MSRERPTHQAFIVEGEELIVRASGYEPSGLARLAAAGVVATPFQSAPWISAFLESHGVSERFRLIELTNSTGNSLLLPLLLTRKAGLVLAEKIGGTHASFFVPASVGDRGGWSRSKLAAALQKAGRMAGIDAFLLADCPCDWNNSSTPLTALPHQLSPDAGAMLLLDADGKTLLAQLSDRDDRKKLRQKRARLAASGELRADWVDAAGIEAALTAFYGWKAVQFAGMGIADPFADPAFRHFLSAATRGDDAPVRLFMLHAGERPLAILGGAHSGGHFSGMFTAYAPDPDVARQSPGEVLISALVPALCADGFAIFDLGIGDARYKDHYCPVRIPLIDIAIPVTLKGRLAALVWRAARTAKRTIKRNGAVFAMLKKIRRRLSG